METRENYLVCGSQNTLIQRFFQQLRKYLATKAYISAPFEYIRKNWTYGSLQVRQEFWRLVNPGSGSAAELRTKGDSHKRMVTCYIICFDVSSQESFANALKIAEYVEMPPARNYVLIGLWDGISLPFYLAKSDFEQSLRSLPKTLPSTMTIFSSRATNLMAVADSNAFDTNPLQTRPTYTLERPSVDTTEFPSICTDLVDKWRIGAEARRKAEQNIFRRSTSTSNTPTATRADNSDNTTTEPRDPRDILPLIMQQFPRMSKWEQALQPLLHFRNIMFVPVPEDPSLRAGTGDLLPPPAGTRVLVQQPSPHDLLLARSRADHMAGIQRELAERVAAQNAPPVDSHGVPPAHLANMQRIRRDLIAVVDPAAAAALPPPPPMPSSPLPLPMPSPVESETQSGAATQTLMDRRTSSEDSADVELAVAAAETGNDDVLAASYDDDYDNDLSEEGMAEELHQERLRRLGIPDTRRLHSEYEPDEPDEQLLLVDVSDDETSSSPQTAPSSSREVLSVQQSPVQNSTLTISLASPPAAAATAPASTTLSPSSTAPTSITALTTGFAASNLYVPPAGCQSAGVEDLDVTLAAQTRTLQQLKVFDISAHNFAERFLMYHLCANRWTDITLSVFGRERVDEDSPVSVAMTRVFNDPGRAVFGGTIYDPKQFFEVIAHRVVARAVLLGLVHELTRDYKLLNPSKLPDLSSADMLSVLDLVYVDMAAMIRDVDKYGLDSLVMTWENSLQLGVYTHGRIFVKRDVNPEGSQNTANIKAATKKRIHDANSKFSPINLNVGLSGMLGSLMKAMRSEYI